MAINKCDCYHEQASWDNTIYGVCWGTKEEDICSCKGDRTKCDFYDNVRNKAKKEQRQAELNKIPDKIIDLIQDFWGTDPAYYCSSTDEKEANFAKLSSTIIEMLQEFKHG